MHEITLPTDVRHRVQKPTIPTGLPAIRLLPDTQDQSSDPQQLLQSEGSPIHEPSVLLKLK